MIILSAQEMTCDPKFRRVPTDGRAAMGSKQARSLSETGASTLLTVSEARLAAIELASPNPRKSESLPAECN